MRTVHEVPFLNWPEIVFKWPCVAVLALYRFQLSISVSTYLISMSAGTWEASRAISEASQVPALVLVLLIH